jgi:hemerythrin-like domain-containing protein
LKRINDRASAASVSSINATEERMSYSREVSRMLDEEHRANLDLLRRIDQALASSARASDRDLTDLLGAFGRQFDEEVRRHFDFEERELFPRLADGGAADMVAILLDEHDTMRAVAGELLPLARLAAAGGLDEAGWSTLRRSALEMVERLSGHIAKETMGMLPFLDAVLDEETDRSLAFAYAET